MEKAANERRQAADGEGRQEGGLRARVRAGSTGREVGARAAASAGAVGVGGALQERAAPSRPSLLSPPPSPGPPPLMYLICMSPELASVRVREATGPKRGKGRGRGGPAARRRARDGPAPRSGRRRPRPRRRRARAQGNKGTRWVLRAGHVHVCAPGTFAGTEREITHPHIPNHVEMSFLTQSTHLLTQSKTGTDTMSSGKMAAPSSN